MEINPGRPFFFPGTGELYPLDYEVNGFREVVIWATTSSIRSVRSWYDKHYRGGCGCYHEEPFASEGFVRYLGNDMGHRLYSVMVGRNKDGAFNELLARASGRHATDPDNAEFSTVGVYFEHTGPTPPELTIQQLAELWRSIYRGLPPGRQEAAIAKCLSFESAALGLAMEFLLEAEKLAPLSKKDQAFKRELQAKIETGTAQS